MQKPDLCTKAVRVEARVRNNILWHAIFDTWRSVTAFCEEFKLSQSEVGSLLNLKKNPFLSPDKEDGKLRYCTVCLRLSVCLKMLPEDLFPADLYNITVKEAVMETSLLSLSAGKGFLSLPAPETPFDVRAREELKSSIEVQLERLPVREGTILRRRFLQGDTLDEVAQDMKVGRERVRQIETKALKRLKHPSRSKGLRSFIE